MKSLQETYAPNSICFGCGPANAKGLKIKSFEKEGTYTCTWYADSHHEAFPGMLNGGIIGSLLDCHSNWSAAVHLMHKNKLSAPPCTVTANYSIQLKRPTPSRSEITMIAKVVESSEDRAKVEASLFAEGKECATCVGLFVAVKEGHPAYHRWG